VQRILVTEGCGCVGSACCVQLLQGWDSVEVVDNLSTGHPEALSPNVMLNQFGIGNWSNQISSNAVLNAK